MNDEAITRVTPRRGSGALARIVRNLGEFGTTRNGRGFRFWELLSIVGFLGGMALIAVYTRASLVDFGILGLVGTAAWLTGGVLGFLFGVPRLRAGVDQSPNAPHSQFTPNTNLEQISDWLTKIIVGATLVQLGPLAKAVSGIAVAVGLQLHTRGGAAATGAVMITYASGGFMWGYLWCSLRIFKEMAGLADQANGPALRQAPTPPHDKANPTAL